MHTRYLQVTVALAAWFCVQSLSAGGYLVGSNGEVVRNSYGECWHTSYWTPEDAIVGCDGKAKPVAAVVVEEPAEPPPVPVRAPERLMLDSAAYFAFDKARLDAEARAELDRLIGRIRTASEVDRITITGHADPIGTESYNQALSERRASAVRDYLAERVGTPDRIVTSGQGETRPMVRCPGKTGAQLIACFAPNRRAEIEVEGLVGEQ